MRRNSDFPEPVAPTHRPCGPMPFRAASLMSSSTGSPCSDTPMGTRRHCRPCRAPHCTRRIDAFGIVGGPSALASRSSPTCVWLHRARPVGKASAAGRTPRPGSTSTRLDARASHLRCRGTPSSGRRQGAAAGTNRR